MAEERRYRAAAVLRRTAQFLAVLLAVSFLTFALMHAAGSDAVLQRMERTGTVLPPETVAAERAALGLDRPFLAQYGSWLAGVLTGDLGRSYVSGRAVGPLFLSRLPATLLLTAAALLLTAAVSVPLGVYAAVRQGRRADRLIRGLSFLGNSVPGFLIGLLLLYLFAVRYPVFSVLPAKGSLSGVVLPAATLAAAMSAKYVRQVRTAVLEELGKDYVTGARARGVPMGIILRRSVLRAALPSLLTLGALSLGSLMGGAVVVESLFRWDGVGRMAAEAVFMRDYPVIEAYVLWTAFFYGAANLAADGLCRLADPRMRGEGGRS